MLPVPQPSFPRLTAWPPCSVAQSSSPSSNSPVLPDTQPSLSSSAAPPTSVSSSAQQLLQSSSPTSLCCNSPAPSVPQHSFPSSPAQIPHSPSLSSLAHDSRAICSRLGMACGATWLDWLGMWMLLLPAPGLLGAGKGRSVMAFILLLPWRQGGNSPGFRSRAARKGRERRMRGEGPPAPAAASYPQPSTADVHFQWDRMPEIPLAPFPR